MYICLLAKSCLPPRGCIVKYIIFKSGILWILIQTLPLSGRCWCKRVCVCMCILCIMQTQPPRECLLVHAHLSLYKLSLELMFLSLLKCRTICEILISIVGTSGGKCQSKCNYQKKAYRKAKNGRFESLRLINQRCFWLKMLWVRRRD